ncbi:MAG: HlyD family efflux transporter periplasmic adaptor subunit [Magnetococcales bacterium]|nr:HlyD family efflux transporter periplasmic adaptor subunit [Magnetococcales bacterium]
MNKNEENEKEFQHRTGRFIILIIFMVLSALVAWSHWAVIDQITRAPGQVVASSKNQVIQAQDGGAIEELFVREGDQVKRNQILLRFDKSRIEASYQEALAKAIAFKANIARLKAEVFGGEVAFPPEVQPYKEVCANQIALMARRQLAVKQEVEAYKISMDLVQTELDLNLPLLAKGDVSKTDILRLQRQVAEIKAQIANRRNKYFQDSQAELAKAQEDLGSAEQGVAARKSQLEDTWVRSPMDGIVRNIRITTQGGVARVGEEIMQIVPLDDDLVIEAKVKPSDIAFVKAGQPTTVKLDAYDYTIYGALHGEVTYLSADTLNEETKTNEPAQYRVRILIKDRLFEARKKEPIVVQTGMTGTVEIKTGSNTVFHYLTKPITKTLSESINER